MSLAVEVVDQFYWGVGILGPVVLLGDKMHLILMSSKYYLHLIASIK